MSRPVRMLSCAFSAFALVLVFSREACAYIDPGTGSLVLQMLIAAVVGTGFAIKIFWKQVKTFVGRLFSRRSKDEAETEGEDETD